MGCGKSKHANVAAGNTVVTKKNSISGSSLTSAVSENNHIVAEANENFVVDAPVVEDEKVEDAVIAPVVIEAEAVNGEVKVDSEPLEAVKVAATVVETAEESQPEITASGCDTVTENAEPEVTKAESEAAAEEITKATSENAQHEDAEAAATEDDSNTASEKPQTEEIETAAEESK